MRSALGYSNKAIRGEALQVQEQTVVNKNELTALLKSLCTRQESRQTSIFLLKQKRAYLLQKSTFIFINCIT